MQPVVVSQSTNAVQGSVYDLWFTLVHFLPVIFAAVIIFIIGWIVAAVLYRIIVAVVRVLRINEVLRSAGLAETAKEAGFTLDIGKFFGSLVMWFVILAALSAALDVLGLVRVTIFIQQVLLFYFPNVIVAALILVLAGVFAEFVRHLVAGSAKAAGAHHGANIAGNVAKWAIWTFAILAALTQLGIATAFIQTLFTGFVIAASIAFGLAFGLGGKDAAARTIERIRSEITHHKR